jgi:RNA polymerase sigma factor (sigma-70 family)
LTHPDTTVMEKRRETLDDAEWLALLRKRFVEVASRRVGASDVEDVVQEALRVIAEKGLGPLSGAIEGRPPVAWCFQVLRNAVGNHYHREDTRRRRLTARPDDDEVGAAHRTAEELESTEALRLIEDALREMGRGDPSCARYLNRIVDGHRPQDVAEAEGLDPPVFYRRLYRCRRKLRDLLIARGLDI